ncbi:MAG: Rrf2 family transcriptional regulator [Clostridiales bacterium]|nr:Rrf2 family transcriptional regulator [Clostridiales bacterium]
MKISTKCSVALHCLIFITEYENRTKVTSELLAKSTGCNAAAIRSILNLLQKAGLIYVQRGVGGAHLKCKPRDISVWSVYNALEPDGLEHLIGCHPNPYEKCPVGQNIREVLKQPYEEIGLSVQKTMQTITLEQLLETYTSLISD